MIRDGHTKRVQWLRILLPVIALSLLGSVFLLTERPKGEAALPFAEDALAERLATQQVTAPWYAGESAAGDAIELRAARVYEGRNRTETISEAIRININAGGPEEVNLYSTRGRLIAEAGLVTLDHGILLNTPDGWRVVATEMTARLDQTRIFSTKPLHARGPLGTLRAGSMELRRDQPNDPLILHFKDGVQLVYIPEGG